MRCCVLKCENNTKDASESERITFHKFPETLNLRKSWIATLGLVDWEPTENSVVCSQHFEQDAFYEDKCGIWRINCDAIPVVPVLDSETLPMLPANQVKYEIAEEETKVVEPNVEMKQDLLLKYLTAERTTLNYTISQAYVEGYWCNCNHMRLSIFMSQKINEPLLQALHIVRSGLNEEKDYNVIQGDHMKKEIFDANIIESTECQTLHIKCEFKEEKVDFVSLKENMKREIVEVNEITKSTEPRILHVKSEFKDERADCLSLEENIKDEKLDDNVITESTEPCTFNVCNTGSLNDTEGHDRVNLQKNLEHEGLHSDKSLYLCCHCLYRCSDRVTFIKHVQAHTEVDSVALGHVRGLRVKLKEQDPVKNKKFACYMCGYTYRSENDLSVHIRRHTGKKSFSCQLCNYRASSRVNLKVHMMIHTGEKPFACNRCDYKCSTKTVLNMHMRTHSGLKPFVCSMCDYSCGKKQNLNRHMQTHKGENAMQCEICDYGSTNKRKFISHVESHKRHNQNFLEKCFI